MSNLNWEIAAQNEALPPLEIVRTAGQLSVYETVREQPLDLQTIRESKEELTREEYYTQLGHFYTTPAFSNFFNKLPEGSAKDKIVASLLADIGPWRVHQEDTTTILSRPIALNPEIPFSTAGIPGRNALYFRSNDTLTIETESIKVGTLLSLCALECRLLPTESFEPPKPQSAIEYAGKKPTPLEGFSPKETGIIKLLFMPNSAIAQKLGITTSTVRTYTRNISVKLGASNFYEVRAQLFEKGLIASEDIPIVPKEPLTVSESAVFRAALGQDKATLATQIGMSKTKVTTCLAGIYKKYGISDRHQLALVKIKQQALAKESKSSE